MSDNLDVMGMSHASAASMTSFHSARPKQPLVMSECAFPSPNVPSCAPHTARQPTRPHLTPHPQAGCSCETQRGEDADLPKGATVYFSNENSACVAGETQRSDAVEYDAGTFVWT
jgi:hypothetical protein